jgi:hypothetical protein
MAIHEVTLQNANKVLLSKDVEIEVKTDGKKLGTLMISKGNIEWMPANHSVNKRRLSWEKFAELMADQPAVKVRKAKAV